MIEREYRLSVKCQNYHTILDKLIQRFNITDIKNYSVYYIKPYFRFKNKIVEIKQTISNVTVYHDGLWFKFIESEEIPFHKWSKNMNLKFLENAGQYSNPFLIEYRTELNFPDNDSLKVYGFQKNDTSGLMFEFEIVDDNWEEKNISSIIHDTKNLLCCFKDIYSYFKEIREAEEPFPYVYLNDCLRKPVIPIDRKKLLLLLEQQHLSHSNNLLVAKKYDGVFGFVYSFQDEIREVWEDNQFLSFKGKSFGDGLVFGAERMSNDIVLLLDVYQFCGLSVVCTENLLLEFLPQLANIYSRYKIQQYYRPVDISSSSSSFYSYYNKMLFDEINVQESQFVDGLIFHDTKSDTIYKLKQKQTLDLVHFDGYYIFPNKEKKKIPREHQLKNGVVYECSLNNLKPLRERVDRFVGNSKQQIEQIFSCN